MDRHSRELAVATRQANRQRLVLLGKELARGMHPVRMDSIADQLDEIDPKVRAVLGGKTATAILAEAKALEPGSPSAFRQLHQEEPFVPPKFQPSFVREKEEMPSATTYVSSETITPTKQGFRKGAKNATKWTMRLKIPNDIARRLVDRLDGLEFEVELNDDGILYRPSGGTRAAAVSLPAWVPLKK